MQQSSVFHRRRCLLFSCHLARISLIVVRCWRAYHVRTSVSEPASDAEAVDAVAAVTKRAAFFEGAVTAIRNMLTTGVCAA